MSVLIIFIQKAIVQGICILYGALGEIMTEKSGNLNLGNGSSEEVSESGTKNRKSQTGYILIYSESNGKYTVDQSAQSRYRKST